MGFTQNMAGQCVERLSTDAVSNPGSIIPMLLRLFNLGSLFNSSSDEDTTEDSPAPRSDTGSSPEPTSANTSVLYLM